jgi:predicted RNase H-like HicB family nuclease
VDFHLEFDQEEDGRWIADIPALPGAMAYGNSQEEAKANAEAIALRVVADSLESSKKAIPAVCFS